MSRRLVVEADGGSRGNPGPAGYGAVVKDAATGEVLAERAAGIGSATNNVAEYGGLIAGLTAALELDPGEVEVRMDSKLVVEQMSGRWQVKHPSMKPLAREASALVSQLPRVRFTWVPRAQNSHADRLANEAMDAARRGEVWRPGGDSGPADAADAWLAANDRPGSTPAGRATGAGPSGAGSSGRASSAGSSDAAPTRTRPTVSAREDGAHEPEPPEPEPRTALPRRLSGWQDTPTPPTTTLLLRHGQTVLSVEKRFSGTGSQPLTDVGRAQASAAAARLATAGAQVVVTSPVRRARETAEVVAAAAGLDLVEEPGLRETDFGDWEGYSFAEVRERWPAELQAWLDDTSVPPPYGESFDATARRVRQARDRVLATYGGQRLVLVSHVTPIKTLLRFALDAPPAALYRMHLDLACLSEVDWYADGPAVVRRMNDTAHLPEPPVG